MQFSNVNSYIKNLTKQSTNKNLIQSADTKKDKENTNNVSDTSDTTDTSNKNLKNAKTEGLKKDLTKSQCVEQNKTQLESYLTTWQYTKPALSNTSSTTVNNTLSSDDINKLFNGQERISAFDIYDKLEEMLNSNNSNLRRFANMLTNAFNRHNISDSDDLKKYYIQEIISQINKQTGRTLSGIGAYNLKQEDLLKLLNSDSFFVELQNILKSSDIVENGFDGKIGDFAQNGGGPCWMFAGLKALNSTTTGQELLQKFIKWSPDKSRITITFQGVPKSYEISLNDIIKKRDMYAMGDIEAVAYAMATEQLRRDIRDNKIQIFKDYEYYYDYNENSIDNGNPGEGLNGGHTDTFFYFLTGKVKNNGNEVKNIRNRETEYLQHLLLDGLNHYSAIITLSNDKLYEFYKNHNVNNLTEEQLLSLKNGGHALAITGISNNTVTLTAPESTIPIEISWDEFCNLGVGQVEELYMYGESLNYDILNIAGRTVVSRT